MTAFAPNVSKSSYLHETCVAAARHLHEQEIALHDARQTDVELWIHRAEARLHDAVLEYEAARSAAARPSGLRAVAS